MKKVRAALAALAAALALMPLLAAPAAAAPYRDLAGAFAAFADRSRGLPDAARLARFDAEIGALFPAFYAPQPNEPLPRYRARVLAALRDFPAIRDRYAAVEAAFPAAYAAGLAHFRATFPDFRAPKRTVLLHSLGQMDGGTRKLDGRAFLLFGADVIARVHALDSIGPLFDHELFHVEHARFFGDCDPVWCGLWQEGLATYAAARLNPGADDRRLMLDTPQPIRAATDARWREALCLLAARRESAAPADYGLFFFANANGTAFPPRFGYYLGYRLAERAGRRLSVQAMARLDDRQAHALVDATLAEMVAEAGGCARPG